jgi:hypothetical protein
MKNFTAKMIKGQIATGAYSHQKNNVKFYVVVWNNKQYFGTDLETLFNNL